MLANNYNVFRCEKFTQKVVRLAVFCVKIFATLCPQNAWQIKIKELLTPSDNFHIVSLELEQFREKYDLQ